MPFTLPLTCHNCIRSRPTQVNTQRLPTHAYTYRHLFGLPCTANLSLALVPREFAARQATKHSNFTVEALPRRERQLILAWLCHCPYLMESGSLRTMCNGLWRLLLRRSEDDDHDNTAIVKSQRREVHRRRVSWGGNFWGKTGPVLA
jgi:hypothetical protein